MVQCATNLPKSIQLNHKFVKVKCDKCEISCGQEYAPKWHKDAGEHVGKREKCLNRCTHKRIWCIPKDADIAFLRRTAGEAQGRSLNTDRENYGPVLWVGPDLAEVEVQRASRSMAESGQINMEFTWSLDSRRFAM